ncbi:Lrp/AsnC family transcriptional regulator [Natrialba sp. PRR66]|uniref:Lrp/AsnC family transcriptional regulator n=1 Tax=Natrialba sp. PRR66 TaxID=3098146 RepID=UPI002B1DD554|nr:Lrp/AsnC family transcriptional regulator [Natrialba sp. PRR66]
MSENDNITEKDIEILEAIGDLKTSNTKELHEKTGIPKSTVHYRIKKMHEMGVFKNDLLEIDLGKLGLSVTVISEVQAEYSEGYHETVGDELSQINGVDQVYFTMGDTDFIVISHLQDSEQVEELVSGFEQIDGVQRTSSKFVIKTIKQHEFTIENYDHSSLESLIG